MIHKREFCDFIITNFFFFAEDVWPLGEFSCKLTVYFQYLSINCSALNIAAFTVERYNAICRPLRAQAQSSPSRAKRHVLFLWLFIAIYDLPWFFLSSLQPSVYSPSSSTFVVQPPVVALSVAASQSHPFSASLQQNSMQPRTQCTYSWKRDKYLFVFFSDLVIFYIIPLLMAAFMYGRMALVLSQSQRMRQGMTDARRHTSLSSPSKHLQKQISQNGHCRNFSLRKERKSVPLRGQVSEPISLSHFKRLGSVDQYCIIRSNTFSDLTLCNGENDQFKTTRANSKNSRLPERVQSSVSLTFGAVADFDHDGVRLGEDWTGRRNNGTLDSSIHRRSDQISLPHQTNLCTSIRSSGRQENVISIYSNTSTRQHRRKKQARTKFNEYEVASHGRTRVAL